MQLENSKSIITNIVLGQSIRSVRLITALFVVCSAITKVLFDIYLPNILDVNFARWALIVIGCVLLLYTYYKGLSAAILTYFTFILYFLTLVYAVYIAFINHFDPSTVTILILVIGAGTVIINSIYYYIIQVGIIAILSVILVYSIPMNGESMIALGNLFISFGVFAALIVLQQKLRFSVGLSHSLLRKLEVLSIMANTKGEIVFVSPTAKSLLGYDRGELLKTGWWDNENLSNGWVSRDHIFNYPNIIPEEIVNMESCVVTKEGKEIWLNWVNSVLPNGNYMGIALDITKYKKDKEKILTSI